MRSIILLILISVFINSSLIAQSEHRSSSPEQRLFDAVQDNNLDEVKILLRKGVNVNARDVGGNASIMYACKDPKYFDILKLLIDAGADSLSRVKALEWACGSRFNNIKSISLILSTGLSPNVLNLGGGTPLMTACLLGKVELVKLLIQRGADVNLSDNEGETALNSYAPIDGNPTIIQLLIRAGADINVKANDGWTALMNASASQSWKENSRGTYLDQENVKTVQILLKSGANVDAMNNDGSTALKLAEEHLENELDSSSKKYREKIIALLKLYGAK
jgi:ankyrin repeat protein